MLFKAFSIVSDCSRFQKEVNHLKDILRKNAFPIKLVDNCIKTFLNKKFLHTPVALTIEKKKLFIALPYLGNLSLAIRTRLQNSINNNLPFCKIKIFFKSTHVLVNFSVLKINCLLTYILMLFANSRVAEVILPIMAKHWCAFRRFTFNRKKIEG